MSYKKRFKVVNTSGQYSPISGTGSNRGNDNALASPGYDNFSNLQDVYSGHINRVDRYLQYENMDQDSEVNAALDIIAEFSTQASEETGMPMEIRYNDTATESEVKILRDQLRAWVNLNDLEKRMFRLFRSTLKYGDQVFIRDPETFELYWVAMPDVTKIVINDTKRKEPEQYSIKNLAPKFSSLVTTETPNETNWDNIGTGTMSSAQSYLNNQDGNTTASAGEESVIDANHIVHCSLTEGLDENWPFGTSILENIYKVYKQKELLEDAIIIYRISRAPERRVFYIDVGNLPSHLAMGFIERIKNEIHQRRIPNKTGGGSSQVDSTYNPLSMNEDFFFPQTAEGRGSKVDTLPGGTQLGEIDDLKFFTNKMFRGLRIPSSYLPTGLDDSSQAVGDGRVGTALIQEYRFNQYCKRLQAQIAPTLDREFKIFLAWRGFNIDSSLFDLVFNEPQNFAAYRQAELDQQRITSFSSLDGVEYLSKRFLLKRFLGLSEAEIVENERMWREENSSDDNQSADTDSGSDLRAAGISPGGLEADLEGVDDVDSDESELSDIDADISADETELTDTENA
jgi:hypothetical protein